jgi:A/G-specific adenine glycosylase
MKEDVIINHQAAAFAREALLEWYGTIARSFPWRYDTNPYHVLIAEMMLRRTQARQVIVVYKRFIAKYPDVASLNAASSDEVMEILHPLGLSWRAANFKRLATELVTLYGGNIPRDRQTLLSLTGVGPYVADAVRCFAFNEPSTLIDTNTVRVAARYFGFNYNPESRRRPAVILAASHLVNQLEPARSNYALLDFAATVCRARDPIHSICPLASHCAYYKQLSNAQPQVSSIIECFSKKDINEK